MATPVIRSVRTRLTSFKLDKLSDLSRLDIDDNGIMYFDVGIRITDGSGVMSRQIRDSLRTSSNFAYTAKLVLTCNKKDSLIHY